MSSPFFIYIADIYCPWCYAFGPIMKRIADEHPDIPVRAIGGDLMSQDTNLQAYGMSDPGLREFWQQVEQTSGRDLSGAMAALRNGRPLRMYSPGANLILTALKELAPNQSLEQLLQLESMFYGEGIDLFSQEAIEMLARRWNLNVNELVTTINAPETATSMERAHKEAEQLMGEITSYPSVMLVRDKRVDAVSRGYVHYETVARRLQDAMQDLGIEEHQPGEFCSWKGNCAFGKRRV